MSEFVYKPSRFMLPTCATLKVNGPERSSYFFPGRSRLFVTSLELSMSRDTGSFENALRLSVRRMESLSLLRRLRSICYLQMAKHHLKFMEPQTTEHRLLWYMTLQSRWF